MEKIIKSMVKIIKNMETLIKSMGTLKEKTHGGRLARPLLPNATHGRRPRNHLSNGRKYRPRTEIGSGRLSKSR